MAKTTDFRTITTTKKTNVRDTDTGGQRGDSNGKRRQMIAEAAYFRAQNRGFRGGNPVEDWLIAEREIDAMLRSDRSRAGAR
jgi:hypothetical protein